MKSSFVFAVVCLGISFAQAASIPVSPTGSCSTDLSAIQSAVNSAKPGDVVQLASGTYDFSCVASNASGVFISNPDITLQGVAGETIFNGPGFANRTVSTGFFISADAVTLDSLTFSGFYTAVHAGGAQLKANRVAVTNSTFQNNIQSVFVAQDTVAPRLVGNTFSVPTPLSTDIFDAFGETVGVIVNRHCGYLLFARNSVTGPGVMAQFTDTSQLIADPHATNVGLHTIGLLETDFSGDIAELGRVSENTFSGLDLAMQASSNMGVVSHNSVTSNAIGIVISNDFDDGVHQITGNIVTQNVASGNQVGIWVASGTQNTITFNDLRNDTLAGILFMANPGGAASTGNSFHQNQATNVVGAAGNTSF